MRMPAGKGFSASPTESPEEIAEPTTQEEVNSALAKDAKRESDADREFAELKRMLGSQNMVDAKKKSTVKEAKDDDTSADSGMIQLSMPVGKGMSTQPTEDGREAPKAAPVVDVLDAIAKDSDGEEDHESEFQALKKLIAAHIKMPSGDNVGKGAPNEPTAPTDKSAGDNEFESKVQSTRALTVAISAVVMVAATSQHRKLAAIAARRLKKPKLTLSVLHR
jgi:hypothetical protein